MTTETRPRLLVLASTFPSRRGDGVPAFVLDLAIAEADGFDVTVLTPQVPGAARHERIHNVDVVRFRYFPSRWEDLADGAILDNLKARKSRWLQVLPLMIGQFFAVRKTVRGTKPDAIHAHWVIPQGMAARTAAPKIPTLVTTHGGDIYALNNPIFLALKRHVLNWSGAVTTVNADMISRLESWGLPSSKLHMLPMGVSLTEVAEAGRSIESEPGRILVVGRLVEKKGFGVLLEALRSHVTSTGWSLTIVGDGPLREELETAAFGLPVTFTGQQGREDVLHAMARTSVLALPSISAESGDQEGLPVVLLEAAAMGCAIVASNLPGINEALADGVNGLLVEQGDPAALGAAIDSLLNNDAERTRLGKAAATRAIDYSIDTIGAGYRKVIAEMMATR
jgi:glycosyltransferase involved in cell wall biosynthesis